MCLIAVCETRCMTAAEIDHAWKINSDGAGVAFCSGKRHVYKKGMMSLPEFKAYYRTLDGVLPHVVHFRRGTCGGVVPELTHPFVCSVANQQRTVWSGGEPLLFHNGVFLNWQDAFIEALPYMLELPRTSLLGPWSDTRFIAMLFALNANAKKGEERNKTMLAKHGKYVVLQNGEIYTYGDFISDKGILFSNMGYKERPYTVYGGYGYDWWEFGVYPSKYATSKDSSAVHRGSQSKRDYPRYKKEVTPWSRVIHRKKEASPQEVNKGALANLRNLLKLSGKD